VFDLTRIREAIRSEGGASLAALPSLATGAKKA
jgi:hypothetical protein